jgi:hypothetical protein
VRENDMGRRGMREKKKMKERVDVEQQRHRTD